MKGKLVRDNIPDIILKNDGKKAHTRRLLKKEYRVELYKKLLEEASELVSATKKTEILNEIADVQEVLDAIILLNSLTKAEVVQVQKKKKQERGGFSKQIFLLQ